jgi:hypothetical protein
VRKGGWVKGNCRSSFKLIDSLDDLGAGNFIDGDFSLINFSDKKGNEGEAFVGVSEVNDFHDGYESFY